jgi:hypothetical protein
MPGVLQIGTTFLFYSLLHSQQEGVGSITFGTARVKSITNIYLESSCRELPVDICMGRIEGGVVWGGSDFLDPPSKILLGHSYKILNTSAKSSAQAQSIGTLFERIG